ncbi:hypothetical protein THAOC_28643 [Thalassiosira oceanica]|uniref:Uncharacterized protein n=1 Tax=Thalassiosira oceanica TaxID=159749 RepID=K0RIM8_THAOC|nr:hypothetical protein THAOC_28643 [Thalassiosira oceanica]|eukprot:EJK52119.1 hypothetical protein THAOC_28643 [Thalassiosira oceanica]
MSLAGTRRAYFTRQIVLDTPWTIQIMIRFAAPSYTITPPPSRLTFTVRTLFATSSRQRDRRRRVCQETLADERAPKEEKQEDIVGQQVVLVDESGERAVPEKCTSKYGSSIELPNERVSTGRRDIDHVECTEDARLVGFATRLWTGPRFRVSQDVLTSSMLSARKTPG